MRIRFSLISATVFLFFASSAFASGPSEWTNRPHSTNGFERDYRVIYSHVWKLIRDQYWDGKFNGQDWSKWEHKFDEKLVTYVELQKAIKAMFFSLGKYGPTYLPSPELDEHNDPKAYLFGLGMAITKTENEAPLIRNLFTEDSPFELDDSILKVSGKGTKNLSFGEVVHLLRGQPKTKVEILILRGGKQLAISALRSQSPKVNEFCTETFEGNVGYIRFGNLESLSFTSLLKNAMAKEENCQSLIIDLRSKTGGTLTNVVDVANVFFKNSPIVTTIDSEGYEQSVKSLNHPSFNKPIVLLTNDRTTGSIEILAAAFKDNRRATIVGQQTAGKPAYIVVTNRLLNGDTLLIPIARWRSPIGSDIEGVGVQPDIKVSTAVDKSNSNGPWFVQDGSQENPNYMKDAQLKSAIEISRKL
ncbi:MAG: hypothetical protein IAF58_21505 [Leptolyngbya sp.]|nr:hypothetical protein [Candidatus Melainabacteria bacterium]